MSKITENAIKNAFKTLLDKKPLNQITVKDITDECGITRNSFYYHYQDIPTLIETIVKEEIDLLAAEQDTIDSLEDCFATIVKYCIHDKKMLLHIYNSVNRNIFESALMKQCEYAVRRYVDSVLNIQDVEDEDREIIIRYLKCLAFGTVIDWFENGMNENIIEHFHRLCELKSGQTVEMIERCKRK